MQPQTNNLAPNQPISPAPAPAQTGYPVTVNFDMPTSQSRILALFSIIAIRILLLLPHIIVLYVLSVAAFIVAWINMWYTLFTGHGSAGMMGFVSGALRWSTRISAYMYGLNDKYPPFSLS